MKVGEFCNRRVIVTEPDTDILDAARLMRKEHVGDIVVVEPLNGGNRPLGILTDRDLVIEVLALEVEPDSLSVGDIMSPELYTVDESTDLWDGLDRMRQKGVRRMPVVDEDGALVGIFTLDDAIELIAEAMDNLVNLMRREEHAEEEFHP